MPFEYYVKCVTENVLLKTISETTPTTCPNNESHEIDAVIKVQFLQLDNFIVNVSSFNVYNVIPSGSVYMLHLGAENITLMNTIEKGTVLSFIDNGAITNNQTIVIGVESGSIVGDTSIILHIPGTSVTLHKFTTTSWVLL